MTETQGEQPNQAPQEESEYFPTDELATALGGGLLGSFVSPGAGLAGVALGLAAAEAYKHREQIGQGIQQLRGSLRLKKD